MPSLVAEHYRDVTPHLCWGGVGWAFFGAPLPRQHGKQRALASIFQASDATGRQEEARRSPRGPWIYLPSIWCHRKVAGSEERHPARKHVCRSQALDFHWAPSPKRGCDKIGREDAWCCFWSIWSLDIQTAALIGDIRLRGSL